MPSRISSVLSLPRGRHVVALLVCCVALSGSTWDRFRGPNGQGVGDGAELPVELGREHNLLWRADIPEGVSSPVLAGGRIFLTGLDGDELVTFALDRSTGAELWKVAAPRPRLEKVDERSHPAAASVATDGEIVVAFFGDFGLVAYSAGDGKPLWDVPLGPFNNLYGMGASPVLDEGRVFLPLDQHGSSQLLAFDVRTGEKLWQQDRPEATSGHSTPILWQPGDGRATSGVEKQLILPGSFLLTSYDVTTGEKLWWVRGLSFEMKSTPALAAGRLFINGYGSTFNEEGQSVTIADFARVVETSDANGNGKLEQDEMPDDTSKGWFPFNNIDGDDALDEREWTYFQEAMATKNNMMAIRLPQAHERGDLTTTHVEWRYLRSVPQLPSPLVYKERLYMINDRGIVTVFDPASGDVTNQGRLQGAVDSFYASPVAGDGKIYFAGRSGLVAAVPADGSLDILAVSDLDEQISATPAIDDGALLVRTDQALWAFALESGGAE